MPEEGGVERSREEQNKGGWEDEMLGRRNIASLSGQKRGALGSSPALVGDAP